MKCKPRNILKIMLLVLVVICVTYYITSYYVGIDKYFEGYEAANVIDLSQCIDYHCYYYHWSCKNKVYTDAFWAEYGVLLEHCSAILNNNHTYADEFYDLQ